MTITKTDIDKLFKELWPAMMCAHEHRLTCLTQFDSIQNYFKKSVDHNVLLKNLCSLEGIGITIATGLIWSAFQKTRVPFDKYTLTYALQNKIIRTNNVSDNYVYYSQKIKDYCDGIDGRPDDIVDFVRLAMEQVDGKDFLVEPE